MVHLILLVLLTVFSLGCQTDILAPQIPSSHGMDQLTIERGTAQNQVEFTLQRIQGTFHEPGIDEDRFTYYYWALYMLEALGVSGDGLNLWDLDTLTTLLFQDHPAGQFTGPYQQITLSNAEGELLVLQSSYFTLPGGAGSLSPSPQGLVQILDLDSDLWFQFLFFADRPAMPVDWWAQLDRALESDVGSYRASVHGEILPEPFPTREVELLQTILRGPDQDEARFAELLGQNSGGERYRMLRDLYWWHLDSKPMDSTTNSTIDEP